MEDVVKINDDRDQVSRMQKGHGGWFDDMTEVNIRCSCLRNRVHTSYNIEQRTNDA